MIGPGVTAARDKRERQGVQVSILYPYGQHRIAP